MANKIFSFSGPTDFMNQSLSASQETTVVPNDVYVDLNIISDPIQVKTTNNLMKSTYKVAKSVNVNAVMNSLFNIFNWMHGERILLPEFGSKLRMMLYEGITPYNEQQIVSEIKGAVSQWDPRIKILEVKDVTSTADEEDNSVRVEVIFQIVGLDEEMYSYNFKYNKTV